MHTELRCCPSFYDPTADIVRGGKNHFKECLWLSGLSFTKQYFFWQLFQKDHTAALIGSEEWINVLQQRLGELSDGTVFFSGAIGTLEGLVSGEAYVFSLFDTVLE